MTSLEKVDRRIGRWHLFKDPGGDPMLHRDSLGQLVVFHSSSSIAITIAVGFKGGAYEHIANRYRQRLARANVTLDIRTTDGVASSVGLLKDRDSGVDAAFLFAGVTNGKE